jgi:hypothetical protein
MLKIESDNVKATLLNILFTAHFDCIPSLQVFSGLKFVTLLKPTIRRKDVRHFFISLSFIAKLSTKSLLVTNSHGKYIARLLLLALDRDIEEAG